MNGNSSETSARRREKHGTRRALRKAREEAYRGLILAAALRVFAQRGYAEAKVQEIAEDAGIATGTVYAVFPSKQELYRAVHHENLAELARRYAQLPGDGSVQQRMLARLETSTRFLTERPDYLRVYLREAGHWGFDPGQLPPDASAFVDAELYRRGVESGELVDEDPQVLQSLAMAAGQVHLFHWLTTGMRESPDALVARIAEHYRRALFA